MLKQLLQSIKLCTVFFYILYIYIYVNLVSEKFYVIYLYIIE